MSLSELYVSGGTAYMHPITVVFISNLILISISVLKIIQKKTVNEKFIEVGKQLGGLALALGVFGTIAGLFQAFDFLASSMETTEFSVIMGGLKVAMITALYGLIVFCISLLAFIILKLIERQSLS
jgi:biopolymer transport protein ExbB/TolQ